MKQKSQNRFLAALLAVAMMLQMLPMLAFAEDATGIGETDVAWIGNQGYTSLEAAVKAAQSGDTITLGKGNYTLYGISSANTTKGKDLTFVGQGPEVTAWNIGAEVPDPNNFGTEYNGDYSFDGAGTVTFKNMTLRSGDANYLGFIRANHTVVNNCVINGKTFYWGYTSAVFTDTTFNAPSGDYAIWTYSSPTMTFDNCTFNASGKVINVYTDYSAGAHDITVNFNNCTVNSSTFFLYKQALNINDSVGTAVVAGGALVGYKLGTDLVGQMWGLPYFPSNRSALAMMLWEDAGKPRRGRSRPRLLRRCAAQSRPEASRFRPAGAGGLRQRCHRRQPQRRLLGKCADAHGDGKGQHQGCGNGLTAQHYIQNLHKKYTSCTMDEKPPVL